MVYVELKKRRDKIYYYHTRGIRLGSQIKKIRRYVGVSKLSAYSKEEFMKSYEEISKKELKFLPKNYIDYKLTYSKNVIDEIFKKNLLVKYLRTFDPSYSEIIEREFPLEFIYHSNNIEGSKLPFSEVRKIVQGKNSNYNNREEVKEAQNSVEAYEFMKKKFKFDEKSILKLHRILTNNLTIEGSPYQQGFKKIEIVVGKYEEETTHPDNVKQELHELLLWYDENKEKMFPPELAFKFYFKYEKIHPFEDGNGRTGRFIMNKILMNSKYEPMIIYKKNKESHLRAFTKGRTGNFKGFTDFMFKKYRKNFEEFYYKHFF